MKMDTRLLDEKNEQDIKEAGKILRRGGLVAIPTETVYGLAGNALDPTVSARISKNCLRLSKRFPKLPKSLQMPFGRARLPSS